MTSLKTVHNREFKTKQKKQKGAQENVRNSIQHDEPVQTKAILDLEPQQKCEMG